jgi:hypothetical protein
MLKVERREGFYFSIVVEKERKTTRVVACWSDNPPMFRHPCFLVNTVQAISGAVKERVIQP